MATETDYAWAAGFFDGEGTVTVTWYVYKRNGKMHSDLALAITQKDPMPLIRFREIFEDISVKSHKEVKRTKSAYKVGKYWRLQYGGWRAGEVLKRMLPYLVVKREVAEVGIELIREIQSFTREERWRGLPQSTYDYRKQLHERIKWLNRGRWAAAEKQASGTGDDPVCGAPNCSDGKAAEVDRNDPPVIH